MREERIKTYVISHLGEDNKFVQEELTGPNSRVKFYKLEEPDEEDNFLFARDIATQIVNFPIEIGSTVIFVMGEDDILVENLCVSTLQRRLNETVTVFVKRPHHKEEIPYLLSLRETRESKDGMVDYNYACSSCSGNRTDCG